MYYMIGVSVQSLHRECTNTGKDVLEGQASRLSIYNVCMVVALKNYDQLIGMYIHIHVQMYVHTV